MEVQVVDSGPCRRSLTIKIPADKIRSHVDDVYRQAAQQAHIKGFRSGKVPRKVLEKRYGMAILAEAKETLINQSFEAACTEKDISFLGRPQLDGVDDSPLDPDNPFEFQVHVDVKPDIVVKRAKGIEVKAADTAVTDEDVQSGLRQLADQKRSLKPVDEPVEDGDFCRADMFFKLDGEQIHERTGTQLNTNIPLAGTDQDVFKNNLIGAEKGSSFELELTFPPTFEKEQARGKTGSVEIRVHEVMRVSPPPIDDDLAKAFDFDSLDALTEEVRKRIGEEKTRQNTARIESEIIQKLLEENPFEIPTSIVEAQKKHLLEQARAQMKEQGMADEAIDDELGRHDEEAAKEATRSVRVSFLLEQIARNEKIFVTEGDVDVELRNIAAANQVSLEVVKKHYEEHNALDDIRFGLRERKVRDFLRDNAKITDN